MDCYHYGVLLRHRETFAVCLWTGPRMACDWLLGACLTGIPAAPCPLRKHGHFATFHYVTSILQYFLLRVKVKIKHHFMKVYGKLEVWLHTFLTTALHGSEWLASHSGLFIPIKQWMCRPHIRSCVCGEEIPAPAGNRTRSLNPQPS